ncbi:YggS family pyridoxal phosphate-dependent enzyme [Streptococcus intermedius]|jgi:pyridoxal phosphate enzyme, yggS family|uniref:Pyridoxal phosphate homeostasis protein n=1 Tax=Streptococcus intermedius TaxID=1338 RepID=A0A428EXJ5_STRIT|nr:YggS family pyridoxal phosphate-dependent enzyme [Streptococcus intermedius]ALF28038.1 cell division protein [Streptococcus intermedius]ARC26273.1 YggS family pyridoxal phosphate-dependent enzyme [Streptococcus intermedius]EHG12657.1 YggS family pyridoxal phosphate enzyme [Streptococcus intermedius F0413]MBF1712633.1 YggS family pyridoxal phosphate-dependent enzyme [Streptococcus intermedius]MCI3917029.1 YggS family pyridoxal phosphate-dependent enzyme [Streptococcus intermedius]
MDLEKNTSQILENVAQVTQQVNRSEKSVEVIAVTKYVDSSTAKELIKAGIHHIGENRVDKFLDKYQALKDEQVTWHLIGTLQRRKVKDVINYVDYFHALDSVKLAQEINKRAEHIIKCFLQVNISKEASKHGFTVEEIATILPELEKLEKIQIVGLMTMAPFEANEAELNAIFQQANQLQKRLQRKQIPNMPFTDLSMGMSRDYAIAIANGSTFVRIGTAFFK